MSNSNTQPLAPALIGDVDLSIEAEPLRPPGYIKLGAPLPFRVPTRPEEITMDWLTDAFRFKGYLTRDGRVLSWGESVEGCLGIDFPGSPISGFFRFQG